MAATTGPPSSFLLSLPTELRIQIEKYAIAASSIKVAGKDVKCTTPSLLLVCKSIYYESLPLYLHSLKERHKDMKIQISEHNRVSSEIQRKFDRYQSWANFPTAWSAAILILRLRKLVAQADKSMILSKQLRDELEQLVPVHLKIEAKVLSWKSSSS